MVEKMTAGKHLRGNGSEQRSHEHSHGIKGGSCSAGECGVDCGREPVEFLRRQNEENIKGERVAYAAYLESIRSLSRKGNKAQKRSVSCIGDSCYFGHTSCCGYNNKTRLCQNVRKTNKR